MSRKFALLATLLLVGLVPHAADARLVGKTFQWQYYAYGGPYFGSSGGQFTVAKKSTIDGSFLSYFNIVSDGNSITFSYTPGSGSGIWTASELSLPPTIHNGIAVNLLSSGAIKSVKINPKTNMVGFDASRVSFTGSQIQVDWQNLPFTPSTVVKLDVIVRGTAAAVTPEVHLTNDNQARPAGSTPP